MLTQEALQAQHQLEIDGERLAVEHDRPPRQDPLQPLGDGQGTPEAPALDGIEKDHERRTYPSVDGHHPFTHR